MRDLALLFKAYGHRRASSGGKRRGGGVVKLSGPNDLNPEMTSLGDDPASYLIGADDSSPEESLGRMESFGNNLALIIDQFAAVGAPTVIGTVPSNLVTPQCGGWPRVDGWEPLYQDIKRGYDAGLWAESKQRMARALAANYRQQASEQENAVIREVAEQLGIRLADVERAVESAEPHGVPGESLFIDHCHLDAVGNELLLETFEAEILALLQEDAPP